MSFEALEPGRGSGRGLRNDNRLHILVLCEQLMVEAYPVLNRMPRSQRYRYGGKLEQAICDLPEKAIQAASARTKTKVGALYDQVQLVHSLLRVCAELEIVSPKFAGNIMRAPGDHETHGGTLRQISAIVSSWRDKLKASENG